METNPQAELYAAIARAAGRVRALKKDGTASAGGSDYRYTTDAEIAAAARDAMTSEGLTPPQPIEVRRLDDMRRKTRNGEQVIYHARFRWLVGHESGGRVELESEGSALIGDKAPYIALTGARKNLLTSMLCIERTDDPEKDGSVSGLRPDECRALLGMRGLSADDVDAWLIREKRSPIDKMSSAQLEKLLGYLSTDAGRERVKHPPGPGPGAKVTAGESGVDYRRILAPLRISEGMVDRWLASRDKPSLWAVGPEMRVKLAEKLQGSEAMRRGVVCLEANREEALAQLGCDAGRAKKVAKSQGDASVLSGPADGFWAFYQFLQTDAGKKAISDA